VDRRWNYYHLSKTEVQLNAEGGATKRKEASAEGNLNLK
jgi:hypothetical protein